MPVGAGLAALSSGVLIIGPLAKWMQIMPSDIRPGLLVNLEFAGDGPLTESCVPSGPPEPDAAPRTETRPWSGAFLQHSGARKFYIAFSFSAMGGKPTGAGRTVVLASFLLGGPSGWGVATTVALGSVAWPMLARAGYEKNAAGDLLAAGAGRRRVPDR
ncbi:MAG: hypothetical protein NVS2B4_12230 [Ramlibacter sp.]